QVVCVCFSLITILFGSTMALKEQHFKRRLAYSTISNLSYMLFGCSLMCAEGLTGALAHFLFHGIIKITLFFVAGIVLEKYKKAYVNDLFGYGHKMKITFGCFTIASLALMGVPPTIGFTSKWYLLTGAFGTGNWMGYAGMAVILISALLTSIYLMSVVIKVYFPGPTFKSEDIADVKDPGLYMTVPLVILCVIIVALGIFSTPLISFIQSVAGGLV
ncbi:MAG: proton-conducting membrane transporter, partial [Lachnospiraceae bacterium]|nr:proton-conducting membrane transporter [Lachnospiraceae bacterium]